MSEPTHLENQDTSLKNALDLLHLLHYRNKNQHRRSPWFKHLCLLRRHLSKFLDESSILKDQSGTSSSPEVTGKSSISYSQAQLRVAARQHHLVSHVLEPCYSAFVALATEGRFCALGLVLLGVLARIAKGLKPLAAKIETTKVDVEAQALQLDLGERVMRIEQNVLTNPGQDLGITLDASDVLNQEEVNTTYEQMPEVPTSSMTTGKVKPTSEKKKKKKRGNAIDDLFSNIT